VGAALGGIVLAAVVVFGLGVMVGKRVAESLPPAASPPLALPTENLPPQPAPSTAAVPPERLTFYDRLSGPAAPAPVALPDTRRLSPSSAAAPEVSAASLPASMQASPSSAALPVGPAAPARERAAAARPSGQAQHDAVERIKKLAGRGRFAVQVAAVNDRAAAEETAARLKRQGFEVLTAMASIKGKTWYRIRVGSFPSQQAATTAAGLFHSGYGFNAIVVHE
jgi:DedD protein